MPPPPPQQLPHMYTDVSLIDTNLTDSFLTDLILADSNLTDTDSVDYTTDFADLNIIDFTDTPLTESNTDVPFLTDLISTDLDLTDYDDTDFTDFNGTELSNVTDNYYYYEDGISENGCHICRENVYTVFSAITVEYSIIEKFNENICPVMNNTEDCQNKVNQWWPYIFSTIYNEQTADFFCTELDPNCEATQVNHTFPDLNFFLFTSDLTFFLGKFET